MSDAPRTEHQPEASASSLAIQISEVDEGRLGDIARLHVDAFPDSVLGRLGVEAVRRNYHWQLTGPHELTALVATEGDAVLGFIFGGIFRGSTIGFVKTQKWFLLRRVLTHPGILGRSVGWHRLALAARLLLRRAPATQIERPDGVPRRSFGVLAIAVAPDAQGRGVGGRLMKVAAERARAANFVGMHLTVHPENTSAVTFYRNLGWVEVREEGSAWSGQMRLELAPQPNGKS
jgi:ribosomal protein S18 acetylase RimI-like enzyme